MNRLILAAPLAAVLLIAAPNAGAQTTTDTRVSSSTKMIDGVPTTKTKVVHTRKRKTHRAKKILGVKVGNKTVTHKTVTEKTSAMGNSATTVKHTSN